MILEVISLELSQKDEYWNGRVFCQYDSELGLLAVLQDLKASDDFELVSADFEEAGEYSFVTITLKLPISLQVELGFCDHYGMDLLSSWRGLVYGILEESADVARTGLQLIDIGLTESLLAIDFARLR